MVTKRSFWRLVSRSLAASGRLMLNHEIPRDAAGISYFCLVALVPSILVLIALADAFLGWMHLHWTVVQRVFALFPGSRQFLSSNLDEITTPSPAVVLSCVIVVVWSSSWIFTFIESSINRAWGVSSQRTFWESRLRSIAFMVLVGFSLLGSAAINAVVSAARARAAHMTSWATANYFIGRLWYLVLLAAGFLLAVAVFTLVFKWMPHRRVFWRDAFSGALVTTLMWEIGSYIFLRLVPHFNYQRIYGKMGAVVLLLAWVYTSNLIMLFGANFSAQLHDLIAEQFAPPADLFIGEKLRRFPTGGHR
jgi:membrane protein